MINAVGLILNLKGKGLVMSIFGSSCDDMNDEIKKKFDRPDKKKEMARLKESIADLKASYKDAVEDGDSLEARSLRDDICEKENKLNNLIDGY